MWRKYPYLQQMRSEGDPGAGADNGAGGDKGGGDAAAQAAAAAAAAAAGGDKGGKGGDGGSNVVWPEQWRETYAKGDKTKLEVLSRYTTPESAFDAILATRQKMSTGELKVVTPFPEKGTPEEQTQWRKDNGLPEAPEKYDLKFEDGLVVGEDDRPIIDDFLKAAHAAHMKPAEVKAAVHWYYDNLEKQTKAQEEADLTVKQENDDKLRSEWGNDYRANINLITGLLDMAPAGLKDRLLGGRLADGTPIGSDLETLKYLAGLARQINPVTALVPGAGAGAVTTVETEIATIEKRMREDRKGYNKDEAMQARYRQLLDARAQLKKQA